MNFYETILSADMSPSYLLALSFLAFYPVATALVWISNSLMFYYRREREPEEGLYHLDAYPMVSVVIPTFCAEDTIRRTLESVLKLDWPNLEVIVVDDASTDETIDRVMSFVDEGKARLVRKTTNEGKSMALNDAMPLARGEIILALDDSVQPDPQLLRWLVPHFKAPRVGGVTANVRAGNRKSLAGWLQMLEYTCVSALRLREQRVWGRGLTEPGTTAAYRKSALIHAGLWTPGSATPDVDVTWKLQREFYDVRFEPNALVSKRGSRDLVTLLRRNLRQAQGRADILTRNDYLFRAWKHRRHWSVLVDAALAISWSYGLIFLAVVWGLGQFSNPSSTAQSGIPLWFALLFGVISVFHVLTAAFIDRKYKGSSGGLIILGLFYPVAYWMMFAAVTAAGTPRGFVQSLSRAGARRRTRTQEARS